MISSTYKLRHDCLSLQTWLFDRDLKWLVEMSLSKVKANAFILSRIADAAAVMDWMCQCHVVRQFLRNLSFFVHHTQAIAKDGKSHCKKRRRENGFLVRRGERERVKRE